MKRTVFIIALALLAAQSAAKADSRIASLCGSDHVNEVASMDDVRPNPGGYYVANLREQIRDGDPRIIPSTSDDFYLCTRAAATPDMDATKALLLMHERTVKYLFVPVIRRDTRGSSCQLGACADHQQALVLIPIPDSIRACLPERIHPVSRQYLDAFLLGHISRAQFLRTFPLPNSDYLAVEDCIIAAIDAPAETEQAAPAADRRFERGGI